MSQSRFTRAPGITAAAVLASFCAVSAQADPVQTIFAAENALYGAGHEIGKADGWMDDTLRSAIWQYQSSNDELPATGNLDPQTLSALGISAEGNSTVSDNAVPNRKAAMAALGLSDEVFGEGSTNRPIAAAPDPEPKPQSEPKAQPEPKPEPEVAIQEEAETEPVAPTPAEPEVVSTEEPTAEPELSAQIPDPVPEFVPEAEAGPEPEPVVTEAEKETTVEVSTVEASTVEEPSEAEFQLPDEPTAAGNPEVSETSDVPEPAAQSSGGFFSSLFDFLFGWLI